MTDIKPHSDLITPAEILNIFKHTSSEEMKTARTLYKYYQENAEQTEEELYNAISSLAYIFTAGRIQGIREQRRNQALKNKISYRCDLEVIAVELSQIKDTLLFFYEHLTDEGSIAPDLNLDAAYNKALCFCTRLEQNRNVLYTAILSLLAEIQTLEKIADKI